MLFIHFLVAAGVNHVSLNQRQIVFYNGGVLDQIGLPSIDSLVLQVDGNSILTVGGFAVANVVHLVGAVDRLHNAGVTCGTGVVEAPIVKIGDHLTGVDVFVQTAVFLGCGVIGV